MVKLMHFVGILIYVSIYVSKYLFMYTRWIWTGCRLYWSELVGAPAEGHSCVQGGVPDDGAGCTWTTRWSELRDALGGRDRVNLEVYLEMVLAALGDGDRMNLEMEMEQT
jgi:hypothetical protein